MEPLAPNFQNEIAYGVGRLFFELAVLAVIVSQARTPQSANGDFVGHFLSISSRMYVASRMAVSTVAIFFGLGLSGFSSSASFRADKIVAANRIANFRSSVIGDSKRGV